MISNDSGVGTRRFLSLDRIRRKKNYEFCVTVATYNRGDTIFLLLKSGFQKTQNVFWKPDFYKDKIVSPRLYVGTRRFLSFAWNRRKKNCKFCVTMTTYNRGDTIFPLLKSGFQKPFCVFWKPDFNKGNIVASHLYVPITAQTSQLVFLWIQANDNSHLVPTPNHLKSYSKWVQSIHSKQDIHKERHK
jgi:hypothetical protein